MKFLRDGLLAVSASLCALYSPGLPYGSAVAGEADVVGVEVIRQRAGVYRFDVTLRHEDVGWEHFADNWQVVGPDGAVLATRVLAHPHVNEQPFTRSLSGVALPAGVTRVTLRAHDSVHGNGGAEMTVELPE